MSESLTEQDIKRIYRENTPINRMDFKLSFDRVVRMVNMAIAQINKSLAALEQKETTFLAKMDRRLAEIKNGKDGKDADQEKIVKDVLKNIRQPKDGETPVIDYQKIAEMAVALIPKPKDGTSINPDEIISQIEKRLPALSTSVRDALELLPEDERPNISLIKGLDQHIKDTVAKHAYNMGGGAVVSVMQSGVQKVQQASTMNFKGAGAPTVTIGANGVTDLDFPAGGTTLLTATGTIDDSNVDFVFASKPVIVMVNGQGLRENVGWTWNTGTLTATLTTAAGVGGDIYALA